MKLISDWIEATSADHIKTIPYLLYLLDSRPPPHDRLLS